MTRRAPMPRSAAPARRGARRRPQAAPRAAQYEFNDRENLVINKIVIGAKVWGFMASLIGLFFLGDIVYKLIQLGTYPWQITFPILLFVALIYIGVTHVGIANSFDAVVKTEGNDIGHTMTALDSLSNILFLQGFMSVLGVITAVILYFVNS